MHSTKVLFSSLHFLVVMLFLCLGFFFYFTPYFSHWEAFLREVVENTSFLRMAGGIFFLSGLLLSYAFYKLYQGHYYQVTMTTSGKNTFVDLSVIRKYAEGYLQKEFTGKVSLQDVICKDKKKLELITKFHSTPFVQQKEILYKIQNEFVKDLEGYLGYKEKLVFTVLVSE